MNSRQIESWALRVVDCVKSGQPNEDFLVELKRDWIKGEKAARRIAGHANAARGENILWLIGVDEKAGVIGVNATDLASWYACVESFFNELAPKMTPLNIPIDNKTVVALLFETDRTPFVVKNPVHGSSSGGSVELEVPWRENTSTRSARRSDLIRLLAPLELLPEVEILSSSLEATVEGKSPIGNCIPDQIRLVLELYFVPKSRNRLVIPFHRCRVEFAIPEFPVTESSQVNLCSSTGYQRSIGLYPGSESLTIQNTANEIIIDGPGRVTLVAIAQKPSLLRNIKDCNARISIYLLPTNFDRPISLTTSLSFSVE